VTPVVAEALEELQGTAEPAAQAEA
jgi:hypothetical protein